MTAAPVLESELRTLDSVPYRINAPLIFHNGGPTDRRLVITGKGCSCYSLIADERELKTGDPLVVPAGSDQAVYFAANLAGSHDEKDYFATFDLGESGDAEEVRGECHLRIYPDVELLPNVLTFPALDAHRPELNEVAHSAPTASLAAKSLTIRRIYRGESGLQIPPEVRELPDSLSASRAVPDGPAVPLVPGLWQETWTLTIGPGEMGFRSTSKVTRIPFRVEFPGDAPAPRNTTAVSGSGNVSAVMPDRFQTPPGRFATGQLVFTRRRGIVAPARIQFGALDSSSTRSRRAMLTSVDQTPFRAWLAESVDGLDVVFDNEDPALQHWLTLSLKGRPIGAWKQSVEIATSHPDEPLVCIELAATIEPDEATAVQGSRAPTNPLSPLPD